MPPWIASVLCSFWIAGLFWLDRQTKERTPKAVWIPVFWLLIAGSRNVSEWLQMQSPDQNQRYLEGSPLDRAVLITLMALGVIVLFTRRRQVVELLRANTAVLLYFFVCLVSVFWSDYPQVTFKRWFRGVGDVVMVLVILTAPDWVPALKRVLTRVGFLLMPISVLLIRYYPALGRAYSKGGVPMWTGVSTDKNGLGVLCLVFGLGAVWRFIESYQEGEGKQRVRSRIAVGILVMTTLYLLWACDSMTSIACFVLASGLMWATGRWSLARKPLVAFLLLVAAVSASAYVLFSGNGGGVLQTMGRNPTLTGRTEIWQVILPFAQSPVFGAGFESFWLGDRLLNIGASIYGGTGLQEAHNGYLEIYLNLGWVGVSLLALVIVTAFRKVLLAVWQDPAVGKLRLAYFLIAVVYNFTEAAFKTQSPVWIFFLLSMMAAPKASGAEASSSLSIEHAPNFTESGPEVGQALSFE